MLILGIDTSTKTGAIALYDNSKGVLSEIALQVKLNHSDTLMEALDTVIKFSGIKMDIFRKFRK